MITIKGMRAIKEADCILYDRLIPAELLKQADRNCETIYVGKADHMHTMKQSQINELLVENACCSLTELRIGGGELLAIGFSGRAVGRAKQRLLDEVASEKLANEHGALVRRAERLYRSGWRGETDGRE